LFWVSAAILLAGLLHVANKRRQPPVDDKGHTTWSLQSGPTSTAAIETVSQLASDSGDYKNEFEVDVFFDRDSAVLDEASKKDLANLADIAKSLDGYMIEISGYASNTLSKDTDYKLSEKRAAAVAHYFREVKGVPMARILVPVGYGTSHPAVSNKDSRGRELNRRVDIKVLVNKSL
jgi:outer membrane protein OmpA-like peptidoglycan-associated protein